MSQVDKTVFVGLSGGVDSSVAALRLQKAGYNVVGVFIKVWHPDWLKCNWEAERLDAMRIAAKLQIPFLTCDAEAAYRDQVAKYFIDEYMAGRTPNPDVMCNKYVKFGEFLRFARENGADFIATGHYAQVKTNDQSEPELHRAFDASKDQSYFLWTLNMNELKHTLFPIGDSRKDKVRQEAEQAGLLTAKKPDSQGICFLGHIDIADFLSHYTDLRQGDVLDEGGNVIGTHKGSMIYTKGQRHGFTVEKKGTGDGPFYVIDRNLPSNTITVSMNKPTEDKLTNLVLEHTNIIGNPAEVLNNLTAETRYHGQEFPVKVQNITGNQMTLITSTETETYSSGQSCVLYSGEKCLGGGIIV